jgi:hypothetical protein
MELAAAAWRRARGSSSACLSPPTSILRGSLLMRSIRNHAKGCAKCARGEGHRLAVLTVSYPGSRTRQFSLRPERVAEVRRWLANYQKLKAALEAICETRSRPVACRRQAVTAPRPGGACNGVFGGQ